MLLHNPCCLLAASPPSSLVPLAPCAWPSVRRKTNTVSCNNLTKLPSPLLAYDSRPDEKKPRTWRGEPEGLANDDNTLEVLLAQGRTCARKGDGAAAVQTFKNAVDLQPRSALARAELGRALVRCGQRSSGFDSLVAAFGIDSLCPGVKEGFHEYYKAEIEADPTNVDLHEGLGALCVDSGLAEEAASCYRRCLELSPPHGQGLHAGGHAMARADRWSVALFKCHASLCDWDNWDAEARAVRAAVRRQSGCEPLRVSPSQGSDDGKDDDILDDFLSAPAAGPDAVLGAPSAAPPREDAARPALHPFDSLSAPLSIQDCFSVAAQQSRAVLASARRGQVSASHFPASSSSDGSRGRVRLGYVSGDLMGSHPLTHLMKSVFGTHDKNDWEVFLYALNPDDGSQPRRQMEQEAEHFRDLSALTAWESATTIVEDGISVLINLNGYAGTAKSADIFALRPAPVSASCMGFPGTMGSPEMADYILADGVVIPVQMSHFYAEKVLRMPNCYFVNDYRQSELAVVDDPPPERGDYGLPPGGDWDEANHERMDRVDVRVHESTVLCNFNRLHKIDPHTFGVWMEVLKVVPGTVLWLLDGGPAARDNLRRRAVLAGVQESRIVFAPLVGKDEHLRRLQLADLFVDTPLYNAHTVGCDALWAGVPLVTLCGQKMASRVGASLLHAVGTPELVARSMDEYSRSIRDLASDGQRRRRLRRKLREARFGCPLFDTKQWVRDAEKLYRWAWERHEAGLDPDHSWTAATPGSVSSDSP